VETANTTLGRTGHHCKRKSEKSP